MEKQPEYDRSIYIAGWVAIGLTLILFAVSAIVGKGLRELVPPCIFYNATGFYCPGCGGIRSVTFLLHGHVIQSIIAYPFVLYTALVGGWFMISQTIAILSKGRFRYALHHRMIWFYIAIALVLINFALKNVLLINGIDIMPK